MRIPDYPPPDRALDGTESLPLWQDGAQRSAVLSVIANYMEAAVAADAANSANAAAVSARAAASSSTALTSLFQAAQIRGLLPRGWFDPTTYPQGAWYRNDYNVGFYLNGYRAFTMRPPSQILNQAWLDSSNLTISDPNGNEQQAVDLSLVYDPCLQPGATVVTIHVSPAGNDTTGDGSAPNPYRSFTKAAAVANAGSSANTYKIIIHITGAFVGNETFPLTTYSFANNMTVQFSNEGGYGGWCCAGMRESYTASLLAPISLGGGVYQIAASNASISTNAKNTPWIYDPSVPDIFGKPTACRWVAGPFANAAAAAAAILATGAPGFTYDPAYGLVFKLASGASPVPGQNFIYSELANGLVLQPADGKMLKIDGCLLANCGRTANISNFTIQPQGFTLGAGQPNVQHNISVVLSNCASLGCSGDAVVSKSGFRPICVNFKDYDSWLDAFGIHTLYTYISVSNDPAQGLYDHMFLDRCFSNENHSGGDGRNPALSPAVNTSANGPTGHERCRTTSINSVFLGSNGSNGAFVAGSHFFSLANVYSGPKIVTPADDNFSAALFASDMDVSNTERSTIFSVYDSGYAPGDAQGRSAVFYVGPSADISVLGFNGVVSKVILRQVKFTGIPTDGTTLTIGAQVYNFRNTPAGPFDVQIGGSTAAMATNLAAAVTANASLSTDTYAYVSTGSASTVSVRRLLTSGQDLTMATTSSAVTVNATNPTITEMSNFAGPPGPPGPAVANGTYGDIVVTGPSTWTVGNGAITAAKMANMAQSTIRGRAAGAGTGTPQDLTVAQVKTILGLTTADIGGLGTAATLAFDTDGTMAADSNSSVPTQAAVVTYVNAVVAGGGSPALLKANNLSDLTNVITARSNLGLAAIAASGSAADLSTGTLPAARLPAFSGDLSSAGGTSSVTVTARSKRTVFTSSGTWTKDSRTVMARVKVIGAGGGGGGGQVTASGTASSGGSGGGGGSFGERMFAASDLGATETVTVGAGGTGGGSAAAGSAGGNTSFGSWLTAYGGGGGFNGVSAANSGGGGGAGLLGAGGNGASATNGTAGATGGATGGASNTVFGGGGGGGQGTNGSGGATGGSSNTGGTGGGCGGGMPATPALVTGATGGRVGPNAANQLTGGLSAGANGSSGTSITWSPGRGGGGGANNSAGNGGNGGTGEAPGGGGGGGGSALTGNTGGTGGTGGAGMVIVEEYF